MWNNDRLEVKRSDLSNINLKYLICIGFPSKHCLKIIDYVQICLAIPY